jgi:hypothetical protein
MRCSILGNRLAVSCGLAWIAVAAFACSTSSSSGNPGSGGGNRSGGTTGAGGEPASGGATGSGGRTSTGGGGNGGATASGGASGGASGQSGGAGSGGFATGGQSGTGGQGGSGGSTQRTGGAAGGAGQTGSGGNVTGGRGGTSTAGASGTATGGQSGSPTGGTGGGRPDGGSPDQAGTSGSVDANAPDDAGGTAGASGPCDIYAAGNTPCVGAHSTVRALYGAYSGNLYEIRRTSDKTTKNIGVLAPGGFADSAAQDAFCAGTKCTISIIYDQSPQHNDLTLTEGGWIGDRAKEADAFGIKVTVGGRTAYGIHVPLSTDRATGVGYRNNVATGTARGDEPESMYMVASGKAFSNECCFDYGNAETNSLNNGNATMEAIYFGNCTAWGRGEGNGPWVMADLENGLFSGKNAGLNSANKSITFAYVTAMLKGKPHTFAIKAGDSQSGALMTMYEGAYPSGGYDPMKKEGAIVLGTGGDNSFMGVGDFFEGAMTVGYASDATDDAVQANIVAAGYGR